MLYTILIPQINLLLKKTIVFLLLFSFFGAAYSQNNIHGTVADSTGKPIAGVNVLLLNAADSSLVKGLFTTDAGNFVFRNISNGKYLLAATHTGYQMAYSTAFEAPGNTDKIVLAPIVLHMASNQLAEVTITAKKPLLEQKIDRLIINVANSVTSAGNTALEILERSPGIVVDHQNNLISMNGKDGVIVMLNGKISRMPASAVVQLLSGMSSGNIEKIELITTPPANFDAEGNAGYINIVLKENDNYGTNGSFSLTGGYSKGFITQNSININHRQGKLNIYGDIAWSWLQSPFTVSAISSFTDQSITRQTKLVVDRINTTNNVTGRAGMDVQLSSHTVLGLLFSGYNTHYWQHENNQNLKYKNNQLDTLMRLANKEVNDWTNYSGNINLQHTYNKQDKLSFNLDYIKYTNNQPVQYQTDYYNNAGSFIYNQLYRSGKKTPVTFWVAALDFNNQLSKNISMDAGLKATVSSFNNDILFERLQQNGYEKDSALSNQYRLKENYWAAYSSLNIKLGKNTDAKLGLRYEYSNSNLGSAFISNIVDRHYGSFFPTVFIAQKIDEKNSINFSYSRRITRPTFNDLAPFTYYADPNTLLTGNPALQPSFSNTVKLDYIFSKYFLSVSYSLEKNAITSFQPSTDPASGKLVLSPENLVSQKTVSLVLSLPVTLTKWWSMQYNFTGLWQQVNALYQKAPVRLEQFNFQVNGNMTIQLPKTFSIELSGFYQSRSLGGITVVKPMGSLDAGIKKNLAGKKGAFVFTVSNVFNNTLNYRSFTRLPDKNLDADLDLQYTQRGYKLTYTRNFGKDKLKQKRERSTGAEDEKGRVQ